MVYIRIANMSASKAMWNVYSVNRQYQFIFTLNSIMLSQFFLNLHNDETFGRQILQV